MVSLNERTFFTSFFRRIVFYPMMKHILILLAVLIIIIFLILFFFHKQIQEMKMEMKEIQSNLTSIHSFLDSDMKQHVQQNVPSLSNLMNMFQTPPSEMKNVFPPSYSRDDSIPSGPSFHDYMNNDYEEEEEEDEDYENEEDYDAENEETESDQPRSSTKREMIYLDDEEEEEEDDDDLPELLPIPKNEDEDQMSCSSEEEEVPVILKSNQTAIESEPTTIDDILDVKTIHSNETPSIGLETHTSSMNETTETTVNSTQETVTVTVNEPVANTEEDESKVIQIEISEKSAQKKQSSMIPDENPEDFEVGHIVQSIHDKKFYQVKENRKKEKHWVKVKNPSS
jgi:hypothetical protein